MTEKEMQTKLIENRLLQLQQRVLDAKMDVAIYEAQWVEFGEQSDFDELEKSTKLLARYQLAYDTVKGMSVDE